MMRNQTDREMNGRQNRAVSARHRRHLLPSVSSDRRGACVL